MTTSTREIMVRVWSPDDKKMSDGMPLVMLAGFLYAIYPNLKNEVFMLGSGIPDATGKIMYEGDIISQKVGKHVLVGEFVWNQREARMGVSATVQGNYDGETDVTVDYNDKNMAEKGPKIIGNIYENPELLPSTL